MSPVSRDDAAAPAALRRAPDPWETPLPGTFGLSLDATTTVLQGGRVVMGGSPLRLLRLSSRAATLVAAWDRGAPVGTTRGAQLLARRLVGSGVAHPRPAPPSLTPADVTVVIPVRDRPGPLREALGALDGLTCIVVDDGSEDPERSALIAKEAGASCIVLPDNRGPAAARNAGLGAATSELVAFVDSDCVPEPGWLHPLLGHFGDPMVAAVAPRILTDAGTPPSALARYGALHSSLDRGEREGAVRPRTRIPYVPSATLVVRRAVTGEPLFDPALRGGEDVDLVWRLVEAGWTVRYVPASTVVHRGPLSLGDLLGRRTFYGATAGPLARRHPDALAPMETTVWSASAWGLTLARRPLLGGLALATSILLLAQRLRGLVDAPLKVALTIAGGGTLKSTMPALSGLTRAWSPGLVLALLPRRTRRAAALALLLPAASEWRPSSQLDPLRYAALHVADDVAYGTGVWWGCLRARTARPLLPRVSIRSRVWGAAHTRDHPTRPDQ